MDNPYLLFYDCQTENKKKKKKRHESKREDHYVLITETGDIYYMGGSRAFRNVQI